MTFRDFGNIATRRLIALFFFAILTPVALVLRLVGIDPMKRTREGDSGFPAETRLYGRR